MSGGEQAGAAAVDEATTAGGPGTGVAVAVGARAAAGVEQGLPRLLQARVASRTAAGDPEVWGPQARDEAAIRLGWTRLHESSRPLVEPVLALRAELAAEGVDRVVLCGMGGSSLAPEVVCAAHRVPLVTLDATDPGQVRSALTDLARTVVVVSSKSGTTVETDSQRRAFVAAFEAAGIDPASRLVVVTDPGSQLETIAREGGYRAVVLADPDVGGRYSALTAFGLVPAGLAGADVGRLLDEAAAVAPQLAGDDAGNPALVLAAAMAATPGSDGRHRDKLVLMSLDDELPGLGDWAEQLIAESTGKQGTGVLPVVASAAAPEARGPAEDILVAGLRGGTGAGASDADVSGVDLAVTGPLGAHLLAWEHATAAAGFLLGINPFDQPDVESAKRAARGLLDATPAPVEPAFAADGVAVVATGGLLPPGTASLAAAVDALLGTLGPRGYLAVMAYLDRLSPATAGLAGARDALAARAGRPVTFGWGPRFLHSTGQYHKGGPAVGSYLQVVGELSEDLEIPGRPFGFARLKDAQAAGDAAVLAEHDRPVLTLRVSDPAGLAAVVDALSRTQA